MSERVTHELVQVDVDQDSAAERRVKIYDTLVLLGVRSFSFYTVGDGREFERRIGAIGSWHTAGMRGSYSLDIERGYQNLVRSPQYELYTEPKYLGRRESIGDLMTGDGLDESESVPLSTVASLLAELDGLVPVDTECWIDLSTPYEIAAKHQQQFEQERDQSVELAAGSLAVVSLVLAA